jgi:hypothetical protein
MFSATLASRILDQALSMGAAGGIAGEGTPTPREVPSAEEAAYWGNHLASLVATGRMPRALLDSLAWDAIGREAGSWVDPLFQGPAPVGDLPGMGDRYRDLVLLGEGATARVFKALDTLLQRQVAIKVLKDPEGPTLVEARAQAQVEHPNVCRIYEVGKGFLVMQLVDGPTLARMAPSLDRTTKLRIVRDIALGVHAAHQKGLLHLDLKLNNVLMEVEEDGSPHPTISDFGMVRGNVGDPADSCPMGTPPYTSPEQLAGDVERLGRATDVYALGVMLYVLLTGAIPFQAHDFPALLKAMAGGEPVPLRRREPNLPRDLEKLVQRCMAPRPEDRYATARDLAEDLDRLLSLEPVRAMGDGRFYRLRKWIQRNPKIQWFGLAALTLLLVTGVVLTRRAAFISQQAEWDHHFQRIVDGLRADLDRIYRLPAHDIDPELARAREVLKTLETTRARGGEAADGPGCLALGQAYRLLGADDTQAAGYFQQAWDLGYRTEAVRAWLTLALVAQYRTSLQAPLYLSSDRREMDRFETDASRRFLQSARHMLEGRGSPDQTMLAHLAELAEIDVRDHRDYERRLQVARAYRAAFPNELDAMFEEAEALNDKADNLAYIQGEKSPVYPPACAAQIEPLREAAWKILMDIRRIAPSHPRIYAALAEACWRQDNSPTERTAPTAALVDQTRTWLAQGREISRTDGVLLAANLDFLGSTVIPFHLARGQDSGPDFQELLAFVREAYRSPSGRTRGIADSEVLNATYHAACYGIDPTAVQLEALEERLAHVSDSGDGSFFSLVVNVVNNMIQTGRDPRPLIQRVSSTERKTGPWGAYQRLVLELKLAEYLHLTAQDGTQSLARAEALLAGIPLSGVHKLELEVRTRLDKARATNAGADWTALEASLERWQETMKGHPSGWALSMGWDDMLEVARHDQEAGRDARSRLEFIRGTLQMVLPKMLWGWSGLDQRWATLCLLQARQASDPIPLLTEGLAAVDRALEPMRPLPPEDLKANLRRRSRLTAGIDRTPALSLKLKGELLLAMARAESRPGAQTRWAGQAKDALEASRTANRNLERSLGPLLEEARSLVRQPGRPHARP